MPPKLNVNTPVDEQSEGRLQTLLEQQANIKVQIDSLRTLTRTTSLRHTRSPIYKYRSDCNVPRSQSLSISPLSRHLSDRGQYNAPMQRTTSGNPSQQSAPGLLRTKSNVSGGNSFMNNDTAPKLKAMCTDTPILDNWKTHGGDPPNEYTFTQLPNQGQRSLSLRHRGLEDVGEDIANYLNRTGPASSNILSTSTHLNDYVPVQSRLYLPLSPQQFGLHSPGSLYSEALTNDSTLSSEISRKSSISDDALVGGFEMIHVDSNSSSFDDDNAYALSGLGHVYTGKERGNLLLGAGGISQASKYSPPSSQESESLLPPPTCLLMESMQRSPSNDSNSSTSSSRSKTQLKRQNQLAAARPLAAKPVASEPAMSREASSQSIIRVHSEDGGEERFVQAIPKPLYQRPLHPKVWCKKCDDYPEGFRGEHELRRHTDRQHKVVVRKWVCSEPCDGLSGAEHPVPINPLSKCKACSQLKKKYGAYYNAAAHLRRAHFNPKPKGRGKGTKIDGKLVEKRGGKGGGDWPSMVELKRWMREVDEFVVENEPQQTEQDDESEGDYMNVDHSEGLMVLSDSSLNATALIGPNLMDSSHLLDIYPMPLPSHDGFQGQNMHMHPSSNIDITLDMPHLNIEHTKTFFDVRNLFMDDVNDLSFYSQAVSSSFPSDHQQHLQYLQQHGHSDDFEYAYNM